MNWYYNTAYQNTTIQVSTSSSTSSPMYSKNYSRAASAIISLFSYKEQTKPWYLFRYSPLQHTANEYQISISVWMFLFSMVSRILCVFICMYSLHKWLTRIPSTPPRQSINGPSTLQPGTGLVDCGPEIV